MFIGIDLGGTHIAAGMADDSGKLLKKIYVDNSTKRDYREIIKDMADLCRRLSEETGIGMEKIKAVGIGSPGTPDNKRGIIIYEPKFNFRNIPMREEFQKHLNVPVFIENDANCAALAESVAGAARGAESSVTITLGTGVGGGIVIDGKIFSGFNFAGSELGHHIIVVNGEQCSCGRKGCWEAYCSAAALVKKAREAAEKEETVMLEMAGGDLSKIDGKIVFEAAEKGDQTAKHIIENYIEYLANGIANIINILMPEVIVIGGGISRQGQKLLDLLQEKVDNYVYKTTAEVPKTKLKIAEMGNDAGIIGAAMLGR